MQDVILQLKGVIIFREIYINQIVNGL